MGKFKFKTIHLQGRGAEKVLGELEAKVMRFLWKNQSACVRETRDALAKSYKNLSFNAVMTIMNRLVEKGLLKKEGNSGVFCYKPKQTQTEFNQAIAKDMLSAILSDGTLMNVSHFAELSEELDPRSLAKLKKLLK